MVTGEAEKRGLTALRMGAGCLIVLVALAASTGFVWLLGQIASILFEW